MTKRFTKRKVATPPDVDPATAAENKKLARLRHLAHRRLLKRRRRKSHQ